MFLMREKQVFDDEVVLGYVFDVFISEKDVLLLVELEVQTEELKVCGLYLFLGECPASKFHDFYLEIEYDHTILPSLETDALGHHVRIQLNQNVVFHLFVLVIKGGRKIMLPSVDD